MSINDYDYDDEEKDFDYDEDNDDDWYQLITDQPQTFVWG